MASWEKIKAAIRQGGLREASWREWLGNSPSRPAPSSKSLICKWGEDSRGVKIAIIETLGPRGPICHCIRFWQPPATQILADHEWRSVQEDWNDNKIRVETYEAASLPILPRIWWLSGHGLLRDTTSADWLRTLGRVALALRDIPTLEKTRELHQSLFEAEGEQAEDTFQEDEERAAMSWEELDTRCTQQEVQDAVEKERLARRQELALLEACGGISPEEAAHTDLQEQENRGHSQEETESDDGNKENNSESYYQDLQAWLERQ